MKILNNVLTIMLVVLITACGGKKNESNNVDQSVIFSGTSSKTWVAKKEYNNQGDKEKLSKEEKKQTMRFYQNGKFSMQSGTDQQSGTWTYNNAAKTLALVFDGADMKEVFDVQELEDDEIKLRAGDGSVMVLETE